MLLECGNNATKFISSPSTVPIPDPIVAPELYAQHKDYLSPSWHAMGATSNAIDSNYKVKGIQRAFVVDSSAIANVPPCNPQAAVMTMGHYLADVNSEVIYPPRGTTTQQQGHATTETRNGTTAQPDNNATTQPHNHITMQQHNNSTAQPDIHTSTPIDT